SSPNFRSGVTVLSRALRGLDRPSKGATTLGVNFVVGADAARARSVLQALAVTFG
ncbi:hypothetical protein MNBD_ACTINO02-2762, partial [hydrothermal vent metagenome]